MVTQLDFYAAAAGALCEPSAKALMAQLCARGVDVAGVLVVIVVGDPLHAGAAKTAMGGCCAGNASEEHILANGRHVIDHKLKELAG